jgi:asparagine synthase (glutamine-hydrolysing)
MCGIAGWIDWEKDLSKQVDILELMSATLARRGPDEKGMWLGEHAALAHRRLSIMDPANGKQPMIYKANGRHVVLVYNGELYNYPEIRADLEKLGHTFRSHCDTEAVLYAFVEWGIDCVLRFDGIFAFAAWDEDKKELALGRDRLGVKPLFYTQRGGSFLFGSEIKTLLAHPLVPPEVDADGLCELLVTCPPGFAATPGLTPYRKVFEVRPGHHMVVTRSGVRDTTYWKLVSKPHEDDAATTVRRVRELLGGAVHRQMASDVPLASLLSGGLDSSAISALAAGELGKKQLQTWCVDFVDADRDFFKTAGQSTRDAPFAKEAADYLHADHHNVVLDASQMIGGLLDCMRARDLPISHQHDTSLLLLFRALRRARPSRFREKRRTRSSAAIAGSGTSRTTRRRTAGSSRDSRRTPRPRSRSGSSRRTTWS